VLSGREAGVFFLVFMLPTKFLSKSIYRPFFIGGAGIVLWEVFDFCIKAFDKSQPSRYNDWLAEKRQETDESVLWKFKDLFDQYPLDPSYLIVDEHPEIKFEQDVVDLIRHHKCNRLR
jgi:hypothetical protein